MPEQTCPSCGAPLPPELGQHAIAPMTGLVECPSCGAQVELEKPGAGRDATTGDTGTTVPDTAGEPESFSGEETVAGVMDELERKPGGPNGDAAGGAT